MSRLCLTLMAPPSIEEKLFDLLLESEGDELFTSVPAFSHGMSLGRLSSLEKVLGRSASVQVQILVTEEEMNRLLDRLRQQFPGSGLRYWASPLALEGEVK